MKLIKIFLNNFKFYGFFNYVKIIFYEFFYQILFLRFSDFKTNTKSKYFNNKYNSINIPTPYYFLKLILTIIKNEQKDVFIDFGCGNGRVLNFFSNYYSLLIGFDINLNNLDISNRKNIKIKKIDLRKISEIKKKLLSIKGKSKILYFYDPFDEQLTEKIIEEFSINGDIIVLINLNIHENQKYKIIFKKQFFDKKRSIKIFKRN